MIDNPCYKCESRKLYCHSKCDKYLVWAKNRERFKEEEIVKYQKINYRKTRR